MKNSKHAAQDIYADLPQGLAAAFCQNAAAMTVFSNLSKTKKKEVIELASNVTDKKEMIHLVQSLTVRTFPE